MYKLLFALLFLPVYLSAQNVTTVAGNGAAGFSGDYGPANAAQLQQPLAMAFDKTGNMYVVDAGNSRVRKIDPGGTITTFAGNGTSTYSGDGGPATAAGIAPLTIATDTAGNVYVTETARIRKINSAGIITTICGTGVLGYSGDGMPATAAKVYYPYLGFVDETGAIYFSDYNNHRIRKIAADGIISTAYGIGVNGSAGDDGPATAANMMTPNFLCRNAKGEIFFSDNGARRIRKIDTAAIIRAFAGTAGGGNNGDGGQATDATVGAASGLACDDSGNIYIASTSVNRVRKVNTSGIITTIAGTGAAGYSGDSGPAVFAQFYNPNHVAVYNGDLFVVDMYNNCIRRVGYNHLTVGNLPTEAANAQIWPNPTCADITISAATAIENVIVTNIAGEVVVTYQKQAIPGERKVTIKTADLPKGWYGVQVNNKYAGKFVKE